jgi:hypothetical protein
VYVYTLRIFDELPFHRTGIIEFHDASGNRKQFGNLRRTETSCSGHDFEALHSRTNGGGLVNLIGRYELELATVLHDALLGRWLRVKA